MDPASSSSQHQISCNQNRKGPLVLHEKQQKFLLSISISLPLPSPPPPALGLVVGGPQMVALSGILGNSTGKLRGRHPAYGLSVP